MALADTSFLIDVLLGKPEALERLDGLVARSEPVWIPALALQELYCGARLHAKHEEEEVARVEALEAAMPPLPLDARAARRAGLLEADLERDGLRPRRTDVQIAAVALGAGEAVVSREEAFRHVPGLEVVAYE